MSCLSVLSVCQVCLSCLTDLGCLSCQRLSHCPNVTVLTLQENPSLSVQSVRGSQTALSVVCSEALRKVCSGSCLTCHLCRAHAKLSETCRALRDGPVLRATCPHCLTSLSDPTRKSCLSCQSCPQLVKRRFRLLSEALRKVAVWKLPTATSAWSVMRNCRNSQGLLVPTVVSQGQAATA